jgi:hypothetical protein
LRIFNNQHFHSTPCSLWISAHVAGGHLPGSDPGTVAPPDRSRCQARGRGRAGRAAAAPADVFLGSGPGTVALADIARCQAPRRVRSRRWGGPCRHGRASLNSPA